MASCPSIWRARGSRGRRTRFDGTRSSQRRGTSRSNTEPEIKELNLPLTFINFYLPHLAANVQFLFVVLGFLHSNLIERYYVIFVVMLVLILISFRNKIFHNNT